MVKKIDFNDEAWTMLNAQMLPELINQFEYNSGVSSADLDNIMDRIWDSGTCKPAFFITLPYLFNIAIKNNFEDMIDLWAYLGCWISTSKDYRENIPQNVLEVFDLSLLCAEKECIKRVSLQEQLDEVNAIYLFSSLFAFAGHRFGYMTMSGYKDDELAGGSVAKCQDGHSNDFDVYNTGIVLYEQNEQPRSVSSVDKCNLEYDFIKRTDNPWQYLIKKIELALDRNDMDENVYSHLELSKLILENGVTPELPMPYAFSLCGSLLLSNGSKDAGMRMLHGYDTVKCSTCSSEFIFAQGRGEYVMD